ncbi:MAG: M13 family metallopeptidase [Acidobacteriota bacterium]
MRRTCTGTALPALMTALLISGPALTAEDTSPALDRKNMDLAIRPGDDFYRYANGQWIKNLVLPDDKSQYESFTQVSEQNRERLRELFEGLAMKSKDAPKGSAAQKIGDFYGVAMDAARIDALGWKPIEPDLERIAKAATLEEMQEVVAGFHRKGFPVIFVATVDVDLMNAKEYSFYLAQGGLGLPDRDYYTNEDSDSQKIRDEYLRHVSKMLQLLGDAPDQADAGAKTVMSIETLLARSSKTRVELRDVQKLYNKMTLQQLQELSPGIDWARYVRNIAGKEISVFVVVSPDFYKELGRVVKEIPLADWKTYLRWHLVSSYAPYLSSAFVDENFGFFGRHMEGIKTLPERWKRMTSLASESLGELVGQMYVEKYFPPVSKRRMDELGANLKKAMESRLRNLTWMSEATKKAALTKLAAMRVEVGYPVKWEDYTKLEVGRESFLDNVMRAGKFNFDKNLDQLGKPVDTTKWDMTPQTVNAGYNPLFNKMIFPAGILQPPFFFAGADDAVNYGAIGMGIGHEMSHGFDDQGRYFDKDGNMRDWWTPDDAEKFKQQTQLLVKQYSAFATADGVHVNGELCLGENIADYAGLAVAYDAYQLSLQGKERPEKIDGFTGGQRFFLAFAQLWRGKIRDEALKRRIQEDVHPWGEFRVNGAPFNVPVFYELFDIKPADKLYRKPDERPAIW